MGQRWRVARHVRPLSSGSPAHPRPVYDSPLQSATSATVYDGLPQHTTELLNHDGDMERKLE